jgi:hypothetical protein
MLTTKSHPAQFGEVDRRLQALERHTKLAPSGYEWSVLFADLANQHLLGDDARYDLSSGMLHWRPTLAQHIAGMRTALHPDLVSTIRSQPHAPELAWLAGMRSAAAIHG